MDLDYFSTLQQLQCALHHSISKWGSDHFDTARRYADLGDFYYERQKYQEAGENYEKVLEIMQLPSSNVYDEGQGQVLLYSQRLAEIKGKLGDLDEQLYVLQNATQYFQTLYKADEVTAEKSHSRILLYQQIILLYADTLQNIPGHEFSSLTLYDELVRLYEKSSENPPVPHDMINQATICNRKGVIYERMGHYAKAITNYQEGEKLIQKVLKPEHPDFLWIKGRISRCKRLLNIRSD